MILGLFLGILYLYTYSEEKFKVCKFIVIVMLTKLTFYYFYPKSDFMLYHLTEKEQIKANVFWNISEGIKRRVLKLYGFKNKESLEKNEKVFLKDTLLKIKKT